MGRSFITSRNCGNENSTALNSITDFYAIGNDGDGILKILSENGFTELPNIIILHANYCVLYTNNSSSSEYSMCLYLEYNPSASRYNGTMHYGWGSLSSYHSIKNDCTYSAELQNENLLLTSLKYPKVRTTKETKGAVGWYI